jgi:hypothetical protein
VSAENDLVAPEVDRPLSTEGSGLLDSAVQWANSVDDLHADLTGDNWIDFALSTGVLTIDAVATYSDPIGSLISAGLGFVLEHIKPFSDWFDELAGDPEAVAAFAATWRNIGHEVGNIRFGLDADRESRMASMEGPGVRAYTRQSKALALKLHVLYKGSTGAADAYEALSELVDLVHDLIRDCLCDIIGSVISYATELILTLGAATPLVIQQASTRVAALSAKVGPQVSGVVTSGRSLAEKLDDLRSIVDQMPRWFREGAPAVPLSPTGRHAPRNADEAVDLAVDGWQRGLPDLFRDIGMKTTADAVKNVNEDEDD